MQFTIAWRGTVYGFDIVETDSLEEAIRISKNNDNALDIKDLPQDWTIDKDYTAQLNEADE